MAKPTNVSPAGKALFVDGINQSLRVDSYGTTNELTEELILELANSEVAEKVNDLTVSASVTYHDYGSIAPFMQAIGQGQWQGEANPARILTDFDINNATVDLLAHVSNDDASIKFAEWSGYMFLTSIGWEWPADGFASETYEYEGEHSRFFLNDWANAGLYKADYSDGSTALISGSNLESTHQPVLLLVNQNVAASLSEAGHSITLTDNGADTNITAVGDDSTAVSFADGDRVRLITSGSGTTFSALSSTPAGIGALRRGHVVPYLYNPNSGNAEATLRIQSLSVDIDVAREELIQLGSRDAYFRELQRPISVTISVDINESDLEEYAKLSGNETAFDAGTLREIDAANYLKTNTLEILIYKDEITHSFANELKRIKFTNVSVTGDESSISTSDTVGTRTITLSSENFLVSGSGVTPFL